MDEAKKTTAVFIDFDNCHLAVLPSIYECLAPEWNATVRRAYGIGLSQHQQQLRQTGTMPIEVVPNIKRKNATDMVLALDVMEHLYRGNTDSIVLVSGDSDFTPLVLKVRESGKPIMVFGYANTPLALQRACTSFHLLRGHGNTKAQAASAGHPSAASTQPGSPASCSPQLKELMENAFAEYACEHAAVTIDRFSAFFWEKNPAFDPKEFGTRSLRSLLRQTGSFQITPIRNDEQIIFNYEIALVTPPHVGDAVQAIAPVAETQKNAGDLPTE